jgi:hypothetical protein
LQSFTAAAGVINTTSITLIWTVPPMSNSTNSAANNKPGKPYPDFPLFPHATGRCAKKIKGRLHYFGRWGRKQGSKVVRVDDVKASATEAVDLYKEQRDDLYAGRVPRARDDGLTVADTRWIRSL